MNGLYETRGIEPKMIVMNWIFGVLRVKERGSSNLLLVLTPLGIIIHIGEILNVFLPL
jgi:hypothetical protein